MTTRSKLKIPEKKLYKLGFPDPLLKKRDAKSNFGAICTFTSAKTRRKLGRINPEVNEKKCEYCKKYKKGKPVAVCASTKYNVSSGKEVIKRRATCRRRPRRTKKIFGSKTTRK